MHNLFLHPMFYIYFVYGMSFITMAFLLAHQVDQASSATIVSTFFLLTIFGLIHGMAELTDWLRFILKTADMGDIHGIVYVSQGAMVISFIFLLQFGINLLTYKREKKAAVRSIPFLLFIIYIAVLYFLDVRDVLKAGLIGRYSFGFAAAVLSAIALFRLSRAVKPLNNSKLERGLVGGAAGFTLYGIFGGLIVQPLIGLPIQLFRAACAIVITVSVAFALDVFKYE